MQTNMSPRSLRRAAERQTAKLAAKTSKVQAAIAVPAVKAMSASANGCDQPLSTLDFIEPSDPAEQSANYQISDARLAANRANAQLSTGPNTAEGKAKSSLNAVKTGLTGRTVVLPTDDAQAYSQHVARHFARLAPAHRPGTHPRPIHRRYRMASPPHRPSRSQPLRPRPP